MPDLSGRTAVVTGAASGLGLEITRALTARGARVVLAVRDTARAERVRTALGATTVLGLDLLDLGSVRRFADEVRDRFTALDLLVLNAGISSQTLTLSAQGVESQFATNHLGHFALTGLLLDPLGRGQDPRVVTVSSAMYARATLDLDHLDGSGGYSPGRAYMRSKLANVLFGRELDRRLRGSGSPVTSRVAHPGVARTPLHTTYPSPVLRLLTKAIAGLAGREPAEAVAPILYAATSPDARPDALYGPTGPKVRPVIQAAPFRGPGTDEALGRALWERSERVTGVAYPVDASSSDA
ncbi:SDR family NAD(P)-dependent oxidoreductase [Streptomyces sp. NPDC091281]|uniref:SDR family NAD(P)-dependent oxidoreductase n=1 Tax=Streptomyces sp. NPDC091281 TaxID=3365985 RepID=UPI003818150D